MLNTDIDKGKNLGLEQIRSGQVTLHQRTGQEITLMSLLHSHRSGKNNVNDNVSEAADLSVSSKVNFFYSESLKAHYQTFVL